MLNNYGFCNFLQVYLTYRWEFFFLLIKLRDVWFLIFMFNKHNADFLFAYEIVLSSHLLWSESQYFDVGPLIFILNQGIN